MDDFDCIIGVELLTAYRAVVDFDKRLAQFHHEDEDAYDASLLGLGCVFTQNEHVIVYAFRQLKTHEENYPAELNMRKRRWMNLLKDYDCEIKYHPGSSNSVADALSHKIGAKCRFEESDVSTIGSGREYFWLSSQADGLLCLYNSVVVLDDSTLRDEILSQAHRSRFSFIQVKTEFRRPGVLLQSLDIPDWKWDHTKRTIRTLEEMLRATVMDFGTTWHDHLALFEFDYNKSYHRSIDMAPFEALYGRHFCTSLFWDEVGKHQVEGSELVHQMIDAVKLIKRRIKAAQDRQASYANTHRRPLHFQPGEHVFLRVSPSQRVMRFGLKGKLSPRLKGHSRFLRKLETWPII
ncbi:uncharacterized protein [Henckelia pumila]|uniref:uncharacterized protein n=1 Tax=Henckelia pumila TaxID=405737 RepID=UPI003C6DC863